MRQLLESCVSTNDEARKLGEAGAAEGSWVCARLQTGGRGRVGRQWSSERGNLFLSMIVRSPARSHWTWVPLAAAVGITQFLRERFPSLDLKIKWPNDLLTPRGKLAGILCESVGNSQGAFLIIGVGVNCVSAPELAEVGRGATSLARELGLDIHADALRDEIADAMLKAVMALSRGEEGARVISAAYDRLTYLRPGAIIAWDSQQGEVLGLGSFGELRVRCDGIERSLYAEEVRLRVVPKAGGESPA